MPSLGLLTDWTDEQLMAELRKSTCLDNGLWLHGYERMTCEALARLLEDKAKCDAAQSWMPSLTDQISVSTPAPAQLEGRALIAEAERGSSSVDNAPDTSTGHIAWQPPEADAPAQTEAQAFSVNEGDEPYGEYPLGRL